MINYKLVLAIKMERSIFYNRFVDPSTLTKHIQIPYYPPTRTFCPRIAPDEPTFNQKRLKVLEDRIFSKDWKSIDEYLIRRGSPNSINSKAQTILSFVLLDLIQNFKKILSSSDKLKKITKAIRQLLEAGAKTNEISDRTIKRLSKKFSRVNIDSCAELYGLFNRIKTDQVTSRFICYFNYSTLNQLRRFLRKGGDPNFLVKDYCDKIPLLLWVCYYTTGSKCLELVKLLVKYGADLNITVENKPSALDYLISNIEYNMGGIPYDAYSNDSEDGEYLETICVLLLNGASPLTISEKTMSEFLDAFRGYNINEVSLELELYRRIRMSRELEKLLYSSNKLNIELGIEPIDLFREAIESEIESEINELSLANGNDNNLEHDNFDY